MVILFAVLIVYCFLYVGTLIQWITPGSVEKYRESQFPTSEELKVDFLKDDFPTVKSVLASYEGLEEYDKEQLNKHALDVYRALIDASITDIFSNFSNRMLEHYDLNLVEKFVLGQLEHDTEKTMEEFLNQPYPYCKKPSAGGSFYTIRQFLEGQIPPYSEGAGSYLNDDINYAEILSVFAMKEDFQFGSDKNTLEQFARLLCSEKSKQLLYEFKADVVYLTEEVEVYVEIMEDGRQGSVFEDIPVTPDEEEPKEYVKKKILKTTGYYYTFKIMPYGLRELCVIADVNLADPDITFEDYTNYEMFDRKETYLRTFARDALKTIGPAFDQERDPRSFAFHQGVKTGRSPEFYLVEADNFSYFVEGLAVWDQHEKPQNPLDIEYTSGSKILNMPYYINQGYYPDLKRGQSHTTIKSSGCIDTCYMMIASYYTGQPISVEAVASNGAMYVGDNFNGTAFTSHYGLNYGTTTGFNVDTARSYIDKGMPLMMRLQGYWNYGGVTYHSTSNTHFIVIMGYDDNGFYVYDPGSSNNTSGGAIPYEAFYAVNGKQLRVPYREGFSPTFR